MHIGEVVLVVAAIRSELRHFTTAQFRVFVPLWIAIVAWRWQEKV